jgi:hypothetical protein
VACSTKIFTGNHEFLGISAKFSIVFPFSHHPIRPSRRPWAPLSHFQVAKLTLATSNLEGLGQSCLKKWRMNSLSYGHFDHFEYVNDMSLGEITIHHHHFNGNFMGNIIILSHHYI